MRKRRSAYRVLVGKPEGKRPLGRPRHRLEDDVKMDLQVIGWGVWIVLIWLRTETHGRLLCEHGNEPLGLVKCSEFCD
jgi:hypothetical protein